MSQEREEGGGGQAGIPTHTLAGGGRRRKGLTHMPETLNRLEKGEGHCLNVFDDLLWETLSHSLFLPLFA